MADIWKMPELNHWWLPESEGYPKLIHEIREWTKEKKTDSTDEFREAVSGLKLLFWGMDLDDSSSQTSPPSVYGGTQVERPPGRSPP